MSQERVCIAHGCGPGQGLITHITMTKKIRLPKYKLLVELTVNRDPT